MSWINETTISLAALKINETTEYFTNATVTTIMPSWIAILNQASVIIMNCTLINLMISMGAATNFKEVWSNLQRPWGSIIGMLCQFGMLPAIGFALSLALQLPPYQALAVLILTCSPGGAASNFFTYWVDGDIALSIVMTSTSSLLAFGGMPLNLLIYTSYWTDEQLKIPYLNVLVSMCFVTGPAVVGMLIRHFKETWALRVSQICGLIGWAGILSNTAIITIIYWDVIISASLRVLIASGCIPIIGFLVAFVVAKVLSFNNKVGRTIGIETGCQNIVVALNVILLSFADFEIRAQLMLVPMVYGLFQFFEVLIAIALFQAYKFKFRSRSQEIQPIANSKCEPVHNKYTGELHL